MQRLHTNNSRGKTQATHKRRGVVTVEFAMTAPILFILVLGGWEFSRINMVRNTADNAAYEGARVAMLPGSTATKAINTAQKALDAVGVNGATISVTPTNIQSDTEQVKVKIRIPYKKNSYGVMRFFKSGEMVKECTLSRELVYESI